jgi:hypothetical protein
MFKKIAIAIAIAILIIIITFFFIDQISKKEAGVGVDPDRYKNCGNMDSSGKYLYGEYSVEFFHPSCLPYNHYCDEEENYCGMGPEKGYDCNKDTDCDIVLTISDELDNVVLKGISTDGYGLIKPNVEVFGHVVKLQEMPEDFPYLALKDTSFGSWGSGYYYHLYSTKDKFEKISEIGPSYDGFYKDNKGNYIIDVQYNYWPVYGSNSDHLANEISFRLTNEQEYAKIGKLFVIDIDANIARLIQFSDNEINRLMAYAKQSNKKIREAFSQDIDSHFWDPISQQPINNWPLKLLRIRESDPSNGYVYGDLFNLIRNGRIDLAKQYFDILVPEQYNQFKEILPESLNTKGKLWKGYLDDLKGQASRVVDRHSEPLWPLYEQLNGGEIPLKLYDYKTNITLENFENK